MADFCDRLLKVLEADCDEVYAWCVLPNHYHTLVLTRKLPALFHGVGRCMVEPLSIGTAQTMNVGAKSGLIAPKQE